MKCIDPTCASTKMDDKNVHQLLRGKQSHGKEQVPTSEDKWLIWLT